MYLRKSRADEEKEKHEKFETLARHEQQLNELARRLELPVDDVYRELVSGESVAARTEFQKLMEGVARRKYAYVICHAIDRLGRGDMMEYGWVLSTFQYSQTLIVTPGKTYNPADPFDLQQLQIQMFFSNAEYLRIRERLKSGTEACVREGQYVGAWAPYGYRKAVVDRKKTLEVFEDEAKIVREVYQRVIAGETKTAICWDLNRRGILKKGKEWQTAKIYRMVTNETYKGMVRWNTMVTIVEGRDGMALDKRKVKGDNPIIAKGLHEPIVDEETWAMANAMMHTEGPRVNRERKLRNPLAGLLVCKKCGYSMAMMECRKHGNVYRYYRHRDLLGCKMHQHRCDEVIEAIVEQLVELAGEYELHIDGDDGGATAHDERLESMRALQADLERRKERLVDLYTDGAIDIKEFRDRRAPIEAKLEELAESIAEEEAFVPKPASAMSIALREAAAMLANDELSAQVRNNALRYVVERIDYSYDHEAKAPIVEVYIKE